MEGINVENNTSSVGSLLCTYVHIGYCLDAYILISGAYNLKGQTGKTTLLFVNFD